MSAPTEAQLEYDGIVEALRQYPKKVMPLGNDAVQSECPNHDNKIALVVKLEDAKVIVRCLKGEGCPREVILALLGINCQTPSDSSDAGETPEQYAQRMVDGFFANNGDELLDRVRDWLGTYISTVVDSDLDLLTVWAVHTHLVMETYTTPRLLIDSPVHESGKTTVIEHLERLCKRSIQMAAVSSPAMLTRMIDKEIRTILIDEADRALDPKKEGIADIIAVLNSGYKRGATRPVLVQKGKDWEVSEMPTFSPVALAGNSPILPDDTRSRLIRVLLMPDASGLIEITEWEDIELEAIALHDEIAAWADQVRDRVKQSRPDLPDGITGRFREKWGPLKRVADAAGGDWPKRVDEMAVNDKKEVEMDKQDGLLREAPAVALLRHIHEVWPPNEDRTANATFVPTAQLIALLVAEYPEMWGPMNQADKGELTAKRLGFMLGKAYKIHSDQAVRGGPRGYHFVHFARPWHRMGITPL